MAAAAVEFDAPTGYLHFGYPPPRLPPIFEAKYVMAKGLRGGCCCKFLILKSMSS